MGQCREKNDKVDKDKAARCYNALLKGDSNFYIVGDEVSHLPAWKEGAILSALNVLAQIINVSEYKMAIATSVPDGDTLVMADYPASSQE